MSDEESFVILGTSPMSSLEAEGNSVGVAHKVDSSADKSLHSDSSGSCFSSLKNSQIHDLQSARITDPTEATNMKGSKAEASLKSFEAQKASMNDSKAEVSLNGSKAEASLNVSKVDATLNVSKAEASLNISKEEVAPKSVEAQMQRSAESMLWCKPSMPANIPIEDNTQVSVNGDKHSVNTQTAQNSLTPTSNKNSLVSDFVMAEINTSAADVNFGSSMQHTAEALLWSKPQVESKEDCLPIDLVDCAVQSTMQLSPKTSMQSKPPISPINRSLQNSSNKENLQPSMNGSKNMVASQNGQISSSTATTNNSLASSFIMGDVNADVLKTSVYSQFPSISMQACAEDVVKLQTMYTEYVELKTTLEKVNNTMKLFYTNSMQWKEKMNNMETHYKSELNECQKQIEALRSENEELKKSIDDQIEQTKAVDIARQNDREDMIKTISEKSSLIENMRAQIVKLEQQHTATFEFLPKKPEDQKESNFDQVYVTRGEHELIVKDLNRQLSEMLASNLDLKDMENQYIDEMNCLKVNLTAAEELIKANRAEITELQSADITKQTRIEELEHSNRLLQTANAEQNERILVLEHQNEVHRKDFEMERDSRQTAMGEKQQVIQDLRALQKRNQELLEERQKLIENHERRISGASSMASSVTSIPVVAAAATSKNYVNNPQRPIRDLTPPSPSGQSVQPPAAFCCPVCNKGFRSLSVLQSHVNDCIDRT